MLGSEFEKYFENFLEFKKYFLGVFSIDNLPKALKINFFFVCNTKPSNAPGEHWFCVIKTQRNYIELFDSLGVNEEKELFYKQNLHFRGFLTFNETPFQSNSSQNCGFFCLYFIFQRLHNLDLTFEELIDEFFDPSEIVNERKVVDFCKELLQ
jgi:hypothetical protein